MDLQRLDDIILDLVKGQSAIAAKLEETDKRIDDHFEGVYKRLDTLNGKVAKHEQELHNQKVALVQQMGDIIQTVNTVTTRVQSLSRLTESHETFINQSKVHKLDILWKYIGPGAIGGVVAMVLYKAPRMISLIKGFLN